MEHEREERLQELILYIASKMEQDQHVGRGRIKLAKLLWRSDFAAFWKFGEPITETPYHADDYGPSPVDELLATRDLETQGRLEWRNDWDVQQIPSQSTPPGSAFSRQSSWPSSTISWMSTGTSLAGRWWTKHMTSPVTYMLGEGERACTRPYRLSQSSGTTVMSLSRGKRRMPPI